jgi:hypothetical protein
MFLHWKRECCEQLVSCELAAKTHDSILTGVEIVEGVTDFLLFLCVLGKQLAQDFYSYNGGYKGGEYNIQYTFQTIISFWIGTPQNSHI